MAQSSKACHKILHHPDGVLGGEGPMRSDFCCRFLVRCRWSWGADIEAGRWSDFQGLLASSLYMPHRIKMVDSDLLGPMADAHGIGSAVC
jgi:hypothetical protein